MDYNYVVQFRQRKEKNMEKITSLLMNLNFSRNEAQVYEFLLENPGMTVYQIAKALNLSRSSIYPIVEKMYEEGTLLLENKEKELYYSEDPNALMIRLASTYTKNVVLAKDALEQVSEKSKRETYLNVIGYDALVAKAKALLLAAKKEVYINTDIDFVEFDQEIKTLLSNEVRVIYFSFKTLPTNISGLEVYSHGFDMKNPNRLMLVVDYDKVLVGNINSSRDEWMGTYTNNPLMVRIISEHIHHDVYLLKIKEKLGMNLFEMHPDIFLGTLNEKGINRGGKNQ